MDEDVEYSRRIGVIERVLLWVAFVDADLARRFSKAQMGQAHGLALIAMMVFAYQSMLLALVAHRIFATTGEVRWDLIAGSVFIATFVLILDRGLFYGPGWYAAGHAEMARAGLDLTGGPSARVKNGMLLAIRIALSAAMSVLLGLVFSIIVFAKDVDRREAKNYLAANATLIADQTKIVDDGIRTAADAEAAQQARVTGLFSQASTLRQREIDPAASDAQTAEAEKELNDLLAQQKEAEDATMRAEDLASREKGGVAGDNLSGRPGDGPRYLAAVEIARNEHAHAAELAAEVIKARARVDAVRQRLSGSIESSRQHAKEDLPVVDKTLGEEEAKLEKLKTAHDALVTGREQAIRNAVERSPNYVDADNGFLGQLNALDQIAHDNPKIGWVILLLEFASAGFELAGVLAKVLGSTPSHYATTLAKESFLFSVKVVDQVVRVLDRSARQREDDGDEPPGQPPPNDNGPAAAAPANDNRPGWGPASVGGVFAAGDHPQPPRKRGRPRKPQLDGVKKPGEQIH